jgi:hypothetical protein
MLILHHDPDAGAYLGGAVELCHLIGATPIILTIARSMSAATDRQQWAQETVRTKGLNAEFDLLVGLEIRNTVLAIARWRRCQLVVTDCQQCQSWCRWLRGPEGLGAVNQSMAFLTIRERTVSLPAESNGATTFRSSRVWRP